ncbi:MAG: hypothetical protein NTY07_08170 [Bacteroidia bacterium]|nr:hypothetical protein [Bacteroidia bacterium]
MAKTRVFVIAKVDFAEDFSHKTSSFFINLAKKPISEENITYL